MSQDLIAQTWAEVGVRRVRPLRKTVFVRTEPPTNKSSTGLIWLPPRDHGFYGQLPHLRLVYGTVLSVGPDCTIKVGERIMFMRLHFARWKGLLEHDAFVGWIDETQVIGYPTT